MDHDIKVSDRPAAGAAGLRISERLILIVTAAVLPMLLLSTGIIWEFVKYQRQSRQDAFLYSARSIASAVDAQLDKYIAVGEVLAASPALQRNDLGAFRDEAEHALAALPRSWVSLADERGRPLLVTLTSAGQPLSPPGPDMLHDEARAFETKQVQISNVTVGPVSKIPRIMVGLPIFRAGEPAYYLMIGVDVKVFRDLLNGQGIPQGWRAGVIDRDGNYVAQSPEHDRYVAQPASEAWRSVMGKEGWHEFTSRDGYLVDLANVISARSGWAVGIAGRKEVFEAPVWRTVIVAGLITLAVAFFGTGLALWAAQKITRSITALETGAGALARAAPVRFPTTNIPELDHAMNAFAAASDTIQRHQTALAEREKWLNTIIEGAFDGIITSDRNGVIRTFNSAASRMFGYEPQEVIGQPVSMLVPIPQRYRHLRQVSELSQRLDGSFHILREVEAVHKDGHTFPVEVAVNEVSYGATPFFVAIITDIKERHEAEARRKLLVGELSHRVKNTLAVVQSIAHQTAQTIKDPNEFDAAFSARLSALAISNDELTKTGWTGVPFSSLLSSHLRAFVDPQSGRLEMSGPEVTIPQQDVLALGMVIHELGTNAIKYGAWSTGSGRVRVSWEVSGMDGSQRLVVHWTEHGGPPPRVGEAESGFGTKIFKASVDVIERRLEADGLVFSFSLALPPDRPASA